MLTISDHGEFLLVTASWKLDRSDYGSFVPAFEEIAANRGKVSC